MHNVLSQVEAFREIPLEGLTQLAARGEMRRFPAGHELMRQGETGDCMHVIVTGRVRVERSHADLVTALVLAELGPGEVVGEMGILSGEPRSATVSAIDDTDTLELSAATVAEAMRALPEMGENLIRILSQRLRRTDAFIESELKRLHDQAGEHSPSPNGLHRRRRARRSAPTFSAPLAGSVAGPATVVTFKDVTERLAVERMKDELISVVSHELRTPLTSIRGALGLLAGGQMGEMPDRAQRMLDIAVSNAERLVRLINDLLDIERIESGKVSMEKAACDVDHLMRQAEEIIETMAAEADVRIDVTPLAARLWADPDRMLQTLTNLLSNAIKFSPPGSTVGLTAEPDGGQILFRVQDQGRGIPPDKIDAVFERFQQVDGSDAREKGGAGLGLAICRSIVQQHGGRIWAESTLGVGSTFCFTVPALQELEPETPAPAVTAPAVLVWDDNPWTQELACAVLEQQGYRPVPVGSMTAAAEQAACESPAAILLNLMAPSANGWERLAILKDQLETRDIPIISFSVLTSKDSAGANGTNGDPAEKLALTGPKVAAMVQAFSRGAHTSRVLIVEDDEDLARVAIATFQRAGIETFHARSGQEAIQMTQRLMPNLLVLDLVLPDGDGYAVVNWLRLHDRLRRLPLVVYTAKDLNDSERKRLRLGQTLFLTKGRVSPQELLPQIVGLLDMLTLKKEGATVNGN